MGTPAGFQYHLGCILLAKECFHLAAPDLAPQHRAFLLIDTMKREHVLGRVDRDALKLHLDGPWLMDDNSTLAREDVAPAPTPTAPVADSSCDSGGWYRARGWRGRPRAKTKTHTHRR